MKNILVDGVWVPLEQATPAQVQAYISALNQTDVLIRMSF